MRTSRRILFAAVFLILTSFFSPMGPVPAARATSAPHIYSIFGPGGTDLPNSSRLTQEINAGVRRWSIELGWNLLQPDGPSTPLSVPVVQAYQAKINAYLAQMPTDGQFILDLGLQYLPPWSTDPNPLTDQYGNQWTSSMANVFWSPTTRKYVADYIQRVFDPVQGLHFANRLWTVRIGVYAGELVYPQPNAPRCVIGPGQPCLNGTQPLWAYDAAAQANCKAQGFPWCQNGVPLISQIQSTVDANQYYSWYVDQLADTYNFLSLLVRTNDPDLHSPYVAPVTPGQGLLPDQRATLIGSKLVQTNHCCFGTGDDWPEYFSHLGSGSQVMNWCSSLGDNTGTDESGTTPTTGWSSAHIQAYYAHANGHPIYGENTGPQLNQNPPFENTYSYPPPSGCPATPLTTMSNFIFPAVATYYDYIGLAWIREDLMFSNNPCEPTIGNYQTMIVQYP